MTGARAALVVLSACGPTPVSDAAVPPDVVDADGDGVPAGEDCADGDADIRPGDSGAPVLDLNGGLLGMVFAAAGDGTGAGGWAVAAEDGTITSVGSYSVRLMSDEGVRYTYLHLDKNTLLVEAGDTVTRGQRLGFVSNEFGGNATTIHLHFEIKMAIATDQGLQNTVVPPYLALVDSYERLITGAEGG